MMFKKSIGLILLASLLLPTFASCKSEDKPADSTTSGTTTRLEDTVPSIPATDLDLTEAEKISTYQNPVLSSKETGYNLGDPFAMRYNGYYYLYVTSPGKGIHCWRSDDLVNWSYKGVCASEEAADGGYAPEVYYYNGTFYMYTSPHGNGHYVFTSDSPTGPFTAATDNLGMSIDGSVFIDNDGKWYFFTAGSHEIQAYTMTSPTTMTFSKPLGVTSMSNSWTEGPMIVYHDGYYYMTITGNHFESLTYRVHYLSGSSNPLNLTVYDNKPVLINTSPEGHHLGHSSTVKGPDLDSYYIVYHSMKDNGYNRDVNVDRIVFNGPSMEVMGPTFNKQQVPEQPDLYAHFKNASVLDGWELSGSLGEGTGLALTAGSSLISEKRFLQDYTAEFNIVSIANGGMAGAIFSYTDASNFGMCLFDPESQKVVITVTVNGESTVKEVKMIQSFKEKVRFDCLQTLQIEKNDDTYTFYMNDRELCKITDCALPGGSVGYTAQNQSASFGFIGATAAVGGEAASDDYKTVSEINGLIPANNYTTGVFPVTSKNKIDAVVAEEGNVLNYRILASADGNYDLAAEYFTGDKSLTASMEIYVDGTLFREVPLEGSRSFTTAIVRDIPLVKGQHTVSFKLKSGAANFTKFTLLKNETVKTLEIDYSAAGDQNAYTDGSWSIANGVLTIQGNPSTGRRLYGDRNWGDYTVQVDITPLDKVNSGIVVRATDPGSTVRAPSYSQGKPTDAETHAAADWVQGYYIGISENNVLISKLGYSYTQLKVIKGDFPVGGTYQLKVVCEGANIKVFVDGELYLDYTDAEDPYIQGMAGVRTYSADTSFDNFKISPLS